MFTGFTDETVDFMWGIRFNNERSWFEAHKQVYLTHFYRPMCDLADEVYEFLRQERPDAGLIRKVTRIYRDARRLHGRGPYKESLWFTVEQPAEQWTSRPAFWFELMPEGWSYGMGYWMPKPVTMAKLRARIDRDPRTMERLTRALGRQREFTLDAERLPASKICRTLEAAGAVVPGEILYHLPSGEADGRAVQPGDCRAAAEWICVSIALLRLFCNTGR